MGIGAVLIFPTILSIITNLFTGSERTTAIAAWSGVAGGGAVLGPVAGGVRGLPRAVALGQIPPRCSGAQAGLATDHAAQLARSAGKVVFFVKHVDDMDVAEETFTKQGFRFSSIRATRRPSCGS
jgi:hypothetical protein